MSGGSDATVQHKGEGQIQAIGRQSLASTELRSDRMYLLTITGVFSQMLIFITLLKCTRCWI